MNSETIEIAMYSVFNYRLNIVVPNVSWGIRHKGRPLHECDILALSKSGYATEIEIKISKQDLLNDKKKRHGHFHDLIARLYFAVPWELEEAAIQNITERAGLYVIDSDTEPKLVKQCKRNMDAVQWSDKQRLKLAHLGCMRIPGLKRKIWECK